MCSAGKPPALDCSKLREAVDTAAGVAGTLWLSYIFLLFYVLLAIVGVTHVDQFLQNNVELPFLQIKLPMLGFLYVGPVIVLLAHAYVLQHLTLLATTARLLNACEKKAASAEATLLGINLFAQMLSGPDRSQNPSTWWVEQIIVWATLVVAPVLTLMYFELQFLPSHNEFATWWARGFMLVDLVLLWWMWPRAICRAEPAWFTGQFAPVGVVFMGLLTAITSYIAIPMGTFPGEQLETWLAPLRPIPLHEALIVGTRETVGDRRLIQPLWPNRLFVQGVDVVDHKQYDTPAKIAMAPVTKSMRGRHLEYAIIIEGQLARADFTSAYLEGASLVRANAMGAWFDHADLSGVQMDYAQLQGASFFSTRMPGVTMDSAQLQGARLAGANLQAAWMHQAGLEGASLAGADLRHATLDDAWLVGANLKDAYLQGASLLESHLEAASLDGAFIWRADFRRAEAGGGMRHFNVDDSLTDAPCPGPRDHSCSLTDTPSTLKDLIYRDIPDYGTPEMDGRKPIFDLLDKTLSPNATQADKASLDTLASYKHLHDQDLPRLWETIACNGKGAPFIITMLIDTYDDEKGWTRPTTREATKDMVKFLLDKDQCTARMAINSEQMMMGLSDLPLLRQPAPHILPPDN